MDELILGNLKRTYKSGDEKHLDDSASYTICAKEKNTDNSIYISSEEMDFITKIRALSQKSKQKLAGFLSSNF